MDEKNNKLNAASNALKILACDNSEEGLPKSKIILQLKDDIVAARAAGKGWKEIVEAVRSAGIDISGAYLRAVIKDTEKK